MPGYVEATKNAGDPCPQCGVKLNPDICEPSSTTRKSVRAWLRAEKEKAQAKSAASENTPAVEEAPVTPVLNGSSQPPNHITTENAASQEPEARPTAPADELEPSIEVR